MIDLGPGAADDGGRVVVTGTPEEVAACARVGDGAISGARVCPRRGT